MIYQIKSNQIKSVYCDTDNPQPNSIHNINIIEDGIFILHPQARH